MIAAVLDTNTIVSGTLAPRGIPHRILEAARTGQFTLITSAVIIAEVFTTLDRDRIKRKYHIRGADTERLRDLLEHETSVTPLVAEVHDVATHPEDDLILATAVSGKADYLVTGDEQLQKVRVYQRVRIVSPREFMDILNQEQPER